MELIIANPRKSRKKKGRVVVAKKGKKSRSGRGRVARAVRRARRAASGFGSFDATKLAMAGAVGAVGIVAANYIADKLQDRVAMLQKPEGRILGTAAIGLGVGYAVAKWGRKPQWGAALALGAVAASAASYYSLKRVESAGRSGLGAYETQPLQLAGSSGGGGGGGMGRLDTQDNATNRRFVG